MNYSTEASDNFGDYNDTLEYIPMNMRPEFYIVPVLFAIIFIIGMIGNGTLIKIFIKHRSMRNVPNMFIVSLAIGDLLLILFCVPFTSTVYTLDSWPYGLVVCKFSEFVKDLSGGVSVFTLTTLSANRCFAIVHPMRKLTGGRATATTTITIAGVWLLSILMALPSGLYSYIRVFPDDDEDEEDYEDDRTFQICYPFPVEFGEGYAKMMVLFHFLVYYVVPLLFIGTFYIIMARHLLLSTRNIPGEVQGQTVQILARKKTAKMVLSFVVIFALCFFPHHLFLMWFYFYPEAEYGFNTFWNICRILGFCLSFMNSCINPIALYCLSSKFRVHFNAQLFCCFWDERKNRRNSNRSLDRDDGGVLGMLRSFFTICRRSGVGMNGARTGQREPGRTLNSETQITVVNQHVVNIRINLCDDHEHIPLQNRKNLRRVSNSPEKLGSVITGGYFSERAASNYHKSSHHFMPIKCGDEFDSHYRIVSGSETIELNQDQSNLSHGPLFNEKQDVMKQVGIGVVGSATNDLIGKEQSFETHQNYPGET